MKVKIDTHINTAAILDSRGLGNDARARKMLASEVARMSDPYVPMQQGILKNTHQIDQEGRAILYPQPYTRYHYYGKVMVGHTPKQATNHNLQHHGTPMRGPFWDKRMMADRGDELIANFAKKIGGHPKQ